MQKLAKSGDVAAVEIKISNKEKQIAESLNTRPGGKNFMCDQNLELPLFLRPIFAKFFPSLEKF